MNMKKEYKTVINNFIKKTNKLNPINHDEIINAFNTVLYICENEYNYPNKFHYISSEIKEYVFPEERNNYIFINNHFIKKDYTSLSLINKIDTIFIYNSIKSLNEHEIINAYLKIINEHCTLINTMFELINKK